MLAAATITTDADAANSKAANTDANVVNTKKASTQHLRNLIQSCCNHSDEQEDCG